eukprot:COSAG05_NODE_5768_length_1092_cov_1.050352_2_plen_86_part_01
MAKHIIRHAAKCDLSNGFKCIAGFGSRRKCVPAARFHRPQMEYSLLEVRKLVYRLTNNQRSDHIPWKGLALVPAVRNHWARFCQI